MFFFLSLCHFVCGSRHSSQPPTYDSLTHFRFRFFFVLFSSVSVIAHFRARDESLINDRLLQGSRDAADAVRANSGRRAAVQSVQGERGASQMSFKR